MTRRQNSITVATAQSQRPSSSAIDASTHADTSAGLHLGWPQRSTTSIRTRWKYTAIDVFWRWRNSGRLLLEKRCEIRTLHHRPPIPWRCPINKEYHSWGTKPFRFFFQWPIINNIAKFKSKPDPLQPTAEFSPILDARTVDDFKHHNGYLETLPLDDLRKDSRVSVEYTPVPYQGGKEFEPGCSLNLYSITALKMEGQILHYDTSSPSKRARLH